MVQFNRAKLETIVFNQPPCRTGLNARQGSAIAKDDARSEGLKIRPSEPPARHPTMGKAGTKDMGSGLIRCFLALVAVLIVAVTGSAVFGESQGASQSSEEMIEDLKIDPSAPLSGDKVSVIVTLASWADSAKVQISIGGQVVKEVEYDRGQPPILVDIVLKTGDRVDVKAVPYDMNRKEGHAKSVSVVCGKAAPTVELGPQSLSDGKYTRKIEASDPDGKPIKLTLIEGPQGMQLGPDGTVTWNFPEGKAGRYSVRVEARNVEGGTSTVSWSFGISMSGGK